LIGDIGQGDLGQLPSLLPAFLNPAQHESTAGSDIWFTCLAVKLNQMVVKISQNTSDGKGEGKVITLLRHLE